MEGNSPAQTPYGEFPIVLYRMGLGALLAKKTAVLTSRGSKTGLLYHTPIVYARDGDMFYTISEDSEQSNWYQNLQANPDAALQIGNWRFAVRAEVLDASEDIEETLAAVAPTYPEFAARAAQAGAPESLKIVRFVPTGYPPEGEIPTDLAWVPWTLGGLVVVVLGRALLGGKGKAKHKEPAEPESPPKKAHKRKPTKKEKKSSKLKLTMKAIKVAPTVVMLARKFSEHQDGERSTKSWFELASMSLAVLRQLTT